MVVVSRPRVLVMRVFVGFILGSLLREVGATPELGADRANYLAQAAGPP